MSKATKKLQQTTVVLGLRRSHLDLVVLRPGRSPEEADVRTRTVEWRKQSTSLTSEAGILELRAAVKLLVGEERLSGLPVSITLSGDFCVTRVVTGTSDRVKRELAQLEARSSLYLSLGTGPKALAASVRQVDARHQHALLTVINQKVLDALVKVAAEAGLKIELIEPSLVATSRALGHMGHDAQQPVMIINFNERGVELGLSHSGRLLLDYRPGGRSAKQEVPEIVSRHMPRLLRYCQRYFNFKNVSVTRVFLCGPGEDLVEVRQGFESRGMTVSVIEPASIHDSWTFADQEASSELSACVGTCLALRGGEHMAAGPNLVERMRAEKQNSLLPLLVKTCWPIAAALLVGAGLLMGAVHQYACCSELQAEIDQYEQARQQVAGMQLQILKADAKSQNLTAVRQQLARVSWQDLITSLAHCMPDDVWLESLSIQQDGKLQLAGASYAEDGVYEFMKWLQKNPRLAAVALEETRPTMLASGPATAFGVGGNLAGYASPAAQK